MSARVQGAAGAPAEDRIRQVAPGRQLATGAPGDGLYGCQVAAGAPAGRRGARLACPRGAPEGAPQKGRFLRNQPYHNLP